MTGPELQAALDRIGWSVHEFARRCQISRSLAANAAAGKSPIPEPVARRVRQIDRAVNREPIPFWPRHRTWVPMNIERDAP